MAVPRWALDRMEPVLHEQDGFVTAAQARRVGVPWGKLQELERAGLLRRVRRGVFVLDRGAPMPRVDERTYAAWLSVDAEPLPWERTVPAAVVSHISAARLHGIGTLPDDDRIWMTSDRRRGIRATDIAMRTAPTPRDDYEWIRDRRIVVMTPARTVVDIALLGVDRDYVERALSDALAQGTTPVEVAAVLERRRRSARRGSVQWLDRVLEALS